MYFDEDMPGDIRKSDQFQGQYSEILEEGSHVNCRVWILKSLFQGPARD